eukprot:CAMPEP_0116946984 /NCGR_PEP_ID=MMETSP0467-20121206/37368_1 /TAXON_ID=283647 /ORGANISM="Mesodinium pulex, Strain SPMC105" /LENGTH=59 /DNA_ID=CAMNT_0004630981 /DNA_START=197 /DNA_END=376 /DNA_ORIENTATION=-
MSTSTAKQILKTHAKDKEELDENNIHDNDYHNNLKILEHRLKLKKSMINSEIPLTNYQG